MANNPYVNKVVYGGQTLIDISDTTATADKILQGYTAYSASGQKITGTATGGGGSVTQDQDGFIVLPPTGGGGGGGAQELTGTVNGSGGTTLQISCSFAPNLIYIYGDMSGSVSNRGIVSVTILKDSEIIITNDGSTSSSNETLFHYNHSITDYGIVSEPHATYSNGVLTMDVITDSSSSRFNSSITYSYKLVGSTPPSPDIPLNTQLIDFTAVKNGYIVDGDTGEEVVSQWSSCSDFTLIDPSMTFSYIGYQWYDIVFYDTSKNYISSITMYQDTDVTITNDYAHGTLTPSKIPSTAKYVRIDSYPLNPSSTQLSLIRTA